MIQVSSRFYKLIMENLIKEFLNQKNFAVVGASDKPHKYGYKILKNLISRGYNVFPINPRLNEIEGIKCYKSISDVPSKIDVVNIVTPPQVTERVVEEALKLGIKKIWIQPGAESEKAVKFCKENGIDVIYNTCVMMH
ncbi:MAG: CoA-binding protein [bacterium]|nr:CoA-binding protein [bacterium]